MNDLYHQAIVLIYPDGEVEEIPIGTLTEHTAILEEHLGHSERFRALCGHLNFGIGINYHITITLLNNGVIVIINYNIRDIIRDPSYVFRCPPQFKVFLCNKYYSEKQQVEFEKVFDMYGHLFVLNKYDAETQKFVPEVAEEKKKI